MTRAGARLVLALLFALGGIQAPGAPGVVAAAAAVKRAKFKPNTDRDPMKEPPETEWLEPVASSTDTVTDEPPTLPAPVAAPVAVAAPTETLKDVPASILPIVGAAMAATAKKNGIVPVANIWVLGGQSRSGTGGGSRSGSASALTGLSIPLSPRLKLLPVYQGYYEATQQIYSSGNSSQLIAHRMDHRLSAKLVYDFPGTPHRVKFSAGYRAELLKETLDEDWGGGLFDYYKPSVGVEWEYLYREPYSLRLGYDWFAVKYPNYRTLESQGALSVGGQTVARELTGGAVLDSDNRLFLAGATGRLGQAQGMWDAWYALTLQDYPDQPIVDPDGQLSQAKRRDLSHALNLSLRGAKSLRMPKKIDGGVRTSLAVTESNQNNFDAFRGRFFPGYYSYRELKVTPYVTLHFTNPKKGVKAVRASLSVETVKRLYPDRVVQDRTGVYGVGSVWTQTRTFSSTLVWPVSERLSLMGTLRRYGADSNTRYEAFYRYRYTSTAYMLGLGYEW